MVDEVTARELLRGPICRVPKEVSKIQGQATYASTPRANRDAAWDGAPPPPMPDTIIMTTTFPPGRAPAACCAMVFLPLSSTFPLQISFWLRTRGRAGQILPAASLPRVLSYVW
jgi:hypothetical protein